MQKQAEKLLDNVATSCRYIMQYLTFLSLSLSSLTIFFHCLLICCLLTHIGRPMSRDEKRDLQRSIKELPGGNLKRIAEIIKDHRAASGKAFSDEVTVNLEEEVSHQKSLT